MIWPDFEHGGKVYSLGHLRSYSTSFVRPAKGCKSAEKFSVTVSFSHHCFTRGLPKDGGTYDPTLRYDYEYDKELRFFDVRRWNLSKQLPAIITKMPTITCFLSKRSNFFIAEMVDENGNTAKYEVFFHVQKSSAGRLHLHVESAYVRDPGNISPRGSRIGFYIILHNKLCGRPIHAPIHA